MHYVIKSFRISCFEFVVEFDSGGDVGGDITVYITDVLGQPLVARTFFFGGNDQHIRAFAKKFVNDLEYRQACLDNTTEWARLANWLSWPNNTSVLGLAVMGVDSLVTGRVGSRESVGTAAQSRGYHHHPIA